MNPTTGAVGRAPPEDGTRQVRVPTRRASTLCRTSSGYSRSTPSADAATDGVIGPFGLLQGKPVRDERLHAKAPFRKLIQHGLEIPSGRPPDEPQRIVPALLFVGRVISAGPVRTGHLKRQLLLVEIVPRELKPDDPDQHDPAAFAAHLCTLTDRLGPRRGRGDDDPVHATPQGKQVRDTQRILALRQVEGFGP